MLPFAYMLSLSFRMPSADVLRELSNSQYTVYDILPSFFAHTDPHVTMGNVS